MSTILAISAVEVFMNLWFRIHASEQSDIALQDALAKDLEKKISIDQKLALWPKRHLKVELNLKAEPVRNFLVLKSRRNSIIHFQSNHESIHASNIIIHGLADTTEYDLLSGASAQEALNTAEEFVAEVFRIAGFDAGTSEVALAGWVGKREPNRSVDAASVPPWLAPHVKR